METLLPSEVARLVYGYLIEEQCQEAAKLFLETSEHLKECLLVQRKGRKFQTKIRGKSLSEFLDLLFEALNEAKSLVDQLPDDSEVVRNILSLLRIFCIDVPETKADSKKVKECQFEDAIDIKFSMKENFLEISPIPNTQEKLPQDDGPGESNENGVLKITNSVSLIPDLCEDECIDVDSSDSECSLQFVKKIKVGSSDVEIIPASIEKEPPIVQRIEEPHHECDASSISKNSEEVTVTEIKVEVDNNDEMEVQVDNSSNKNSTMHILCKPIKLLKQETKTPISFTPHRHSLPVQVERRSINYERLSKTIVIGDDRGRKAMASGSPDVSRLRTYKAKKPKLAGNQNPPRAAPFYSLFPPPTLKPINKP